MYVTKNCVAHGAVRDGRADGLWFARLIPLSSGFVNKDGTKKKSISHQFVKSYREFFLK
jgi:hypothetical protein